MFNKLKYLVDFVPLLFLFFILEILNRSEINQKALVFSLVTIIIYCFIQKFFKTKSFIISKLNKALNQFRLSYLIFIVFISTLTIISQNYFLNFELIDWDIPSYLVAASDVLRGNLPLENQWESKGPLFFYLYGLILILSGKNLIYFKIFNDLILLFISLLIFKTCI